MNKTEKTIAALAVATAAAVSAAIMTHRQRVTAKLSNDYLELAKRKVGRPVAGGWIFSHPQVERGRKVYHGGVITKSAYGRSVHAFRVASDDGHIHFD